MRGVGAGEGASAGGLGKAAAGEEAPVEVAWLAMVEVDGAPVTMPPGPRIMGMTICKVRPSWVVVLVKVERMVLVKSRESSARLVDLYSLLGSCDGAGLRVDCGVSWSPSAAACAMSMTLAGIGLLMAAQYSWSGARTKSRVHFSASHVDAAHETALGR
jgi:hypothetical protein